MSNYPTESPMDKIRKTHPKLHYQIAESQQHGMQFMNLRIAQVKLMGKVRYIDRDDRVMVYYTKEDIATVLAHESVLILGWEMSDGKRVPVAKSVPLFRWWCTTPDRKKYSEVVYLPFRPNSVAKDLPDGALNTFKGFAINPAFNGPYSFFKEHVEQNIAGGDPVMIAWLWDFMADMFQNPTKRPPVMLVLRGAKGVGKSTFSEVLTKLIGADHCPVIDSEQGLTGRFAGATFERAMLLVIEEAYFAGNLASMSRLNSLVTSTRLPVEHKNLPTYMAPAYFRMVMTANADHVVPSGPGERRFVVADVLPTRKQDSQFFGAMWKELEAGGIQTLLADLMKRDLTKRDWSRPPMTRALADQVRLSMRPDERWWASVLTTGIVPYDRAPEGADAETTWSLDNALTIRRSDLLASFQQGAKTHGGSQTPEALGRFLRKVVGADNIGFVKATLPFLGRANCYVLPPRRDALATFLAGHTGLILEPEDEATDLDIPAAIPAAMPEAEAEAEAMAGAVVDLAARRAIGEGARTN